MRSLLTTVVLLMLAATLGLSTAASPVAKQAALPPLSEIHDRQILVEVDLSRGTKAVSAVCASHSVKQVSSLPLSYATYQVVQVPAGRDYYATLAALQADPAVKAAGPNVIKHCSSTLLNDPLLLHGASSITQGLEAAYAAKDQWGLLITGAPDAWDSTTGDPGIIVAVLDTGVNFAQEDIVHRYWTNTDEIAGNGIDDDDNGFIDDVRGWDFTGFNDGAGGDNDSSDPSGEALSHGMCTASIIAAEGNNGLGMSGVAGGNSQATGIRLMVLRVGTETMIDVKAEIGAIDYAIQNGARAISMSFGGVTGGQIEEDAINRAWNAGVLPIAAAGNNGQGNDDGGSPPKPLVDLPAGFDNCMAVAATTIFETAGVETKAYYSKTGTEVDIAAPGTRIIGAKNSVTGYTDTGEAFSGTSAATPIVAGLAGLLLSKNSSLSVSQLREAIESTAVDLGAAGKDIVFGNGRIDMAAALASTGGSGDTNGDGVVDGNDIQPIKDHFGVKRGGSGYVARIDANGDGVIDELDLFVVGRNFGTTP
jgi:subtilisin family serine protease